MCWFAGAASRVTNLPVRAVVAALTVDHLAERDIALRDAIHAVGMTELAWRAVVDATALLVHITAWVFGHAMAAIRVADLPVGAEALTLILGADLAGVEVLGFAGMAALIAMLAFGAVVEA